MPSKYSPRTLDEDFQFYYDLLEKEKEHDARLRNELANLKAKLAELMADASEPASMDGGDRDKK